MQSRGGGSGRDRINPDRVWLKGKERRLWGARRYGGCAAGGSQEKGDKRAGLTNACRSGQGESEAIMPGWSSLIYTARGAWEALFCGGFNKPPLVFPRKARRGEHRAAK